MEANTLRSWIISAPRPDAVRCVGTDGQTHTLEIKQHGQRWIDVARSICALGPDLVEALDGKGNVLRAVRAEELEPEAEEERDDDTIEVSDPNSAQLVIFARLLADAYKDSREFTATAFDKLGTLFESTQKRAEALQRTVEALMRRRIVVDEPDEPSAASTFEQELLSGILQGQQQGALDKAIAAALKKQATNGAAKNPAGESNE